jgi:hypothetical protein
MGITELIVIVVLSELGLHYFPWRMLIGRKLPRLGAYTLGLLGMMVPLSAWLMVRSEIEILQTLWIVNCAAGMTVFALYGLDHYLELQRRDIEAGLREQVMTNMLKSKPNEQSEQA